MFRLTFVALVVLILTQAAHSADDPLSFNDPQLQTRYNRLLEELRCLVCQNQSLADSHADLAQDMRNEVHAMLNAGREDQAIIDFLVERYGDFVRYRPPVKNTTWALWLAPFVLAIVGGIIILRRRRRSALTTLTAEEKARLSTLLDAERNSQ